MPAKNIQRVDKNGVYFHIYNNGVEKRTIFNDEEDYEVFLGYLKEYLTAPADPKKIKKAFTVNDRVFHGVPHQPKNYFNKVELVAYGLMPSHFHLLLHQKSLDSIQNFIRSLCTRYAMYYNKKYQRTGSLFQGPYKSVQIKDVSHLIYLTRYLHRESFKENGKDLTRDNVSSYKEYLGIRQTSWVKPKTVLSFFDKSENNSFKGTSGYKNFVEKYELDQKEKKLLEELVLESESEHLESRPPALPERGLPERVVSKEVHFDRETKPRPRIPEFIAASVGVFVLLLGLGVRNISVSAAKIKSSSPSPIPLISGVEDVKPEPKVVLVIKISDGAESVNIRQEPRVQSEKIGEALAGDTFNEFSSVDSEWYEIKLADGSTGFVSARYAEEEETNN